MAEPNWKRPPRSYLPNSEPTGDPQYTPPRDFLGIPIWAAAVGFAVVAAVMFLVMLLLG